MARAWTRGRGLHPVLVAEIGQRQRRLAGERVLGGQRHQHRILEQQMRPEPGAVPLARARELEQQRQVELAGAQPRRDLLGFALGERERDVRVALAEHRDRERHQRGPRGRERGHPQTAGPHPEHRRQVCLGSLDPGEDRLGVLDQTCARGGRPHASAVPDDQGRAGLRLEPRDRLRHGGLGVRQRLSGARERPPPDHLGQHPDAAHVQH